MDFTPQQKESIIEAVSAWYDSADSESDNNGTTVFDELTESSEIVVDNLIDIILPITPFRG
jgi:hypothetical protein